VKSLTVILVLAAGCAPPPESAPPGPIDFAHFRIDQTPPAASPSAAVSPGAAATVSHLPAAAPSSSISSSVRGPSASHQTASPSVSLGDEPGFDLESVESRSPKPPERPLSPRVADHLQPPDAPAVDGDALADASTNSDVPAHWTGAVIYCQPGCGPCAALERDLHRAGWRVGTKGSPHFRTVSLETLADFRARNVPSTPCIVYFIDGQEVPPRIVGYDGTPAMLAQICARHPKAKKTSPMASGVTSPQVSVLWNLPATPTCRVPLYYESNICGAPAGSFSAPVATSVTYSDPVYYSAPVYSAPIYSQPVYAAPSYQSAFRAGPATYSAGVSLFGFPLIGGSVGATF
jgi:hypothetical protein